MVSLGRNGSCNRCHRRRFSERVLHTRNFFGVGGDLFALLFWRPTMLPGEKFRTDGSGRSREIPVVVLQAQPARKNVLNAHGQLFANTVRDFSSNGRKSWNQKFSKAGLFARKIAHPNGKGSVFFDEMR